MLQYIKDSPYSSSPYQDVIFPESWVFGAFSGFVRTILPIVKTVILGIVLLRIARTNQPFSDQNKKNLQWYGILEAAQVLTSIFSWDFKFSNIINFLINCAIIVIWFCWPGSAEQNTDERGRKKARIFYITMIGVQTAVIVVNALYYFEFTFAYFLHRSSFLFSATNITFFASYLFSCCYVVMYYNQIGRVFRSVSKGISKFDPANVKRIKSAAWIRIIGTGILTIVSVLSIAKFIWESLIYSDSLLYSLSYVLDTVNSLALPFVILCLAFAYKYGALESEPILAADSEESGQPDAQIDRE